MVTRRQALTDWLLEHPRLDFFVAAGGIAAGWRSLTVTDQIALVGAVAGVAGGLLGMTAVVMGLYAGQSNKATATFQVHHGGTIGRNWSSILLGFGVAGVVAMASPMVPVQPVAGAILGYGLALTAICMLRLAWFLRTYFALAQRPNRVPDRDQIHW